MTDNRTTELMPCPFCGGEAKESSPESNGTKFWRITCQHCYARIGGTHRGMNQAAWNTRAERTCECGWRGFVDGWGHEPPNYCQRCGGKAVSE